MLLREFGAKLLLMVLMCMPAKDGQPRVNAKPKLIK